jgi:fructose-1,6-bisphosphatase/inositol monophosphatase family enzyme
MVDAKVNFWDVACVEPIITEAGGMISDLQGIEGLGSSCIAGNPVIVKEALELLA